MAAKPMPPPARKRMSSTTGNNAVAGTEAAICASGCTTEAMRGRRPTATPTGTVHNNPIASAAITRAKVAPAP